MPHTHPNAHIDLQQISTRNEHARHIVAGCASALPTLADMWQILDDALTDTATLSAQVTRLSAELERIRLECANLRAAMRATLAAHADGEPDPMWYLRDELNAPESLPPASRRPR
jgi:outer membrane murein-binding lipoprotein Lpp